MQITILGAGSIGCFVGGLLAQGKHPVTLIGRAYNLDPIASHGLSAVTLAGQTLHTPAGAITLSTRAEDIAHADLVLVSVKGTATAAVCQEIERFAKKQAIIVSLQNGLRNPAVLERSTTKSVLAGMVPFNVVQTEPGTFVQTTGGDLYLQQHPVTTLLAEAIAASGIRIHARQDMKTVLWSKLLLNLNNPVNALSGIPLKPMLLQRHYRCVLSLLQKEALALLRQKGQPTCRIGRLYPPLLPHLLRLPTGLFRVIARTSLDIAEDASSSMQDDLRQGRRTEIDSINGEILALAEKLGSRAPCNDRIVTLVHQAEEQGPEYRHWSGEDLLQDLLRAI